MVQRPNIAAMSDVPSRLSGKGSAKITLGLQKVHDSCRIERCHNSGVLVKVNKVLVCKRYPCTSHSGKGVQCSAKGCPKYVKPVQQENAPDDVCLSL
jgi:hypothetical protein